MEAGWSVLPSLPAYSTKHRVRPVAVILITAKQKTDFLLFIFQRLRLLFLQWIPTRPQKRNLVTGLVLHGNGFGFGLGRSKSPGSFATGEVSQPKLSSCFPPPAHNCVQATQKWSGFNKGRKYTEKAVSIVSCANKCSSTCVDKSCIYVYLCACLNPYVSLCVCSRAGVCVSSGCQKKKGWRLSLFLICSDTPLLYVNKKAPWHTHMGMIELQKGKELKSPDRSRGRRILETRAKQLPVIFNCNFRGKYHNYNLNRKVSFKI